MTSFNHSSFFLLLFNFFDQFYFFTHLSISSTITSISFAQFSHFSPTTIYQAWDSSAEYYRLTLLVYQKYVQMKNQDNLPALITGEDRTEIN